MKKLPLPPPKKKQRKIDPQELAEMNAAMVRYFKQQEEKEKEQAKIRQKEIDETTAMMARYLRQEEQKEKVQVRERLEKQEEKKLLKQFDRYSKPLAMQIEEEYEYPEYDDEQLLESKARSEQRKDPGWIEYDDQEDDVYAAYVPTSEQSDESFDEEEDEEDEEEDEEDEEEDEEGEEEEEKEQFFVTSNAEAAKYIIKVDDIPRYHTTLLRIYKMGSRLYICGSRTYVLKDRIKQIGEARWGKVKCWSFPLNKAKDLVNFMLAIRQKDYDLWDSYDHQLRVQFTEIGKMPTRERDEYRKVLRLHKYKDRLMLCGIKPSEKNQLKTIGSGYWDDRSHCWVFPINKAEDLLAYKNVIAEQRKLAK